MSTLAVAPVYEANFPFLPRLRPQFCSPVIARFALVHFLLWINCTGAALWLGGAFLIGCCGFSLSGDLLSPLQVGELLLAKISLHLGTTLTRASSVGTQLVLLLLLVLANFLSITSCCVLSSSRFACKSCIMFSAAFAAYLTVSLLFLLVLACSSCCIITQSISLRFSLTIWHRDRPV